MALLGISYLKLKLYRWHSPLPCCGHLGGLLTRSLSVPHAGQDCLSAFPGVCWRAVTGYTLPWRWTTPSMFIVASLCFWMNKGSAWLVEVPSHWGHSCGGRVRAACVSVGLAGLGGSEGSHVETTVGLCAAGFGNAVFALPWSPGGLVDRA